jgi:predicted dehydrogenase
VASTPAPVRIGIIGGGWRADYYLRIAQQVPASFAVGGVLVRSSTTAERITTAWGAPVVRDFESFLRLGPFDYVVLAIAVEAAAGFLRDLVTADIPVLMETPPARDLATLNAQYRSVGGAPIQVAEQYQFQPHHAARMSVARSGILGSVHTAYVSTAHDYHAMALVRQALLAGFGPVGISGRTIVDLVQSPRGRDDWRHEIVESRADRVFAWLDFEDGSLGTYDFLDEQYVSPIRGRTLKLSGTRGELTNDSGDYVVEPGRAAPIRLSREATGLDGDLEGSFLRRIVDGEHVHWENEYPGARLNDDELAVARAMGGMAEYARSGVPFYSLADGSQDRYLGLLIADAVKSGRSVHSEPQAWSGEASVFGG